MRGCRQMSVSEFFPNNWRVPEGYLFVILKTYFDAGNKDDSSQYSVLSLAAICGTVPQWKPFERAWRRILKKHNADYLHVTEALTGNDIYSGWEETQVDMFLMDCVKVAGRHGIKADGKGNIARFGLFPYVSSVVLKDFLCARFLRPEMPPSANEPVFRTALTASLLWGKDQAECDEYHMVFDRGEPFYGILCNLLESKKARLESGALKLITAHTQACMQTVPAIQLADLFAWGISHKLEPQKKEWHKKLLELSIGQDWRDSTNMFDVHPDAGAWTKWRIPKRKATR